MGQIIHCLGPDFELIKTENQVSKKERSQIVEGSVSECKGERMRK